MRHHRGYHAADVTSRGLVAGRAARAGARSGRRRWLSHRGRLDEALLVADNLVVAILRGLAKPVRYMTLLAGALPALAFPDAHLEFLAWFGLVPGLLLMRAAPS